VGGGSQGFFGSLWSCIVSLFLESKDRVHDAQNIDATVEKLDPINSQAITPDICEQSYKRQSRLYEHEIFQPLDANPVSFPSTADVESGIHPILDKDS